MLLREYDALHARILATANRFQQDSHQMREIIESVRLILLAIQTESLSALQRFTQQFDKQLPSNFWLECTVAQWDTLTVEQKKAVDLAIERIQRFQKASLPQDFTLSRADGELAVLYRSIESVGVYVPGGHAPLLSTLMMTVIPAQIAGVKRIVVVSPPPVHDFVRAVAYRLGVKNIFQAGGAQAIAALAYGISELDLSPVNKIVGPGNHFVTQAKKEVYGTVGIDALYGPSELMITADETAHPTQIVCDLVSQLEHGSGMEAAILLTESPDLAEKIQALLKEHLGQASQKAWERYGTIGIVDSKEQIINLINLFAPEHLELKTVNDRELLSQIRHAGAIFLGKSNEALGDYLAGPSHCLPTGRTARFSSGLSVNDFLLRLSMIDLSPEQEMIDATVTLACMEGLLAHAKSAANLSTS